VVEYGQACREAVSLGGRKVRLMVTLSARMIG